MSHGEDRHGILRSSNFELLRIFSILCVVLHHLLIDELYQCGYHSPSDGSDFIPLFINGLAIIGVNLFILISGWFGIKSPLRSIFRIILDYVILRGIPFLILWITQPQEFTFTDFVYTIRPSNSLFVANYIILAVVSPILEVSMRGAKTGRLVLFVTALAFCNLYFGYYKQFSINTDGYNAINFIFLYYIGRLLCLSKDTKALRIMSWSAIPLWIVIAVTEALIFQALAKVGGPSQNVRMWYYNSPFVLLSAIFVFSLFANLKIQSKLINTIASATFGVYILHGTLLVKQIREPITIYLFGKFGYIGVLIQMFALAAVCYIVSLLWTLIRKGLTYKVSETLAQYDRQLMNIE